MPTPAPPITLSAASRRAPSDSTAPAELIVMREVCRRTGLGHTTIYKLIAAGKFPPGIKDPDIRATRWLASTVEAWILDRHARAGQ